MLTSPSAHTSTPSAISPGSLPVEDSRALGLALLIASVGAFWCVFGAIVGWVAHRALTP